VDIGRLSATKDGISITDIGTGAYFSGGAMVVSMWECVL
jgi:hypothetical protein